MGSSGQRIGSWKWDWMVFLVVMDYVIRGAQAAADGVLRKDAEGLIEFKKGVTDDPQGVLNGWVTKYDGNPCTWYGVKCSLGRVTSVDLSNAGVTGNLRVEELVSVLDKLDTLVLKGNNFTGDIGSNLNVTKGNGCSIKVFDLSDNHLSGILPMDFLSSCQELVSLNMSHNSITAATRGTGSASLGSSVKVVDLSRNLLSGDSFLSGILANCQSLEHLDLSYNRLNGSLPQGIGQCAYLVSLNLSSNLFTDGIPKDLVISIHNSDCNGGNCSLQSRLQLLDLSNNNISGPLSALELGDSCGQLTVLNLSSNSLTGKIPSHLGNCKSLKLLNLSANKLSDTIPASLGGLASIVQLLVSKNNLNGNIPPELGGICPTVQELDLSSNTIIGSIPSSFAACSSLRIINLSNNQLSGKFLGDLIGSLQSLKALYLSYNNLTGSIPLSLTNCTTLEVLDLSSNNISGTIPPGICTPSSSLQRLYLPDNHLTGQLPQELANCRNLRSIDFSFNNLNGAIPAVLGSLPYLQDLIIWLNQLTGEIPEKICSSGSLETLILNHNSITGKIPDGLANCPNLVWISLSSNRLNGSIPSSLGQLDKLAILQLGNNSLSGKIPSELGNCRSLIWLDVNSNMLEGSIPAALALQSGHIVAGRVAGKLFAFVRNEGGTSCRGAGGLLEFSGIRQEQLLQSPMLHSCPFTRVYLGVTMYTFTNNGTLIYLDLSYNSLSGTIPEEFGTMYYLQVLNLGHNKITGPIPMTFGGLKQIGVLDMSHNNLQGFIPGSLGGLSFLSDLDVSNNNLTGPIPSSGQLMTFPAARYDNNSGLCGLPLDPCGTHQPRNSADSSHQSSESGRDGKARASLAGSVAVGLVFSLSVIIGLIFVAVKTRKQKKQEDMRDKYMDSLPTSGSGSWKLSGVLEPLSINVATFEKPLRKLTFAHLLEATNGFSADSLIGSGGFGDVYKAQLKDGSVVAIKKLIHVSGQGDREFTAEMETIGKIKHRNLVPLLGYCKVGEERLLVYEYMKWGSLETVLHEKIKGSSTLDWAARKKIAIGSARGLAFLHHSCIPLIIHRDMKSSNVLLDENMEARVSDFGMARLMNALDTHLSVSTLAGTPGYVPPEYYQSFRCTTKGDVYSYGVILLELLSGKRPIDPVEFGDNNLVGWMKQNVKLKKFLDIFDPLLIKDKSLQMDLIQHLRIACECLDDRPWRRPTMIQVMAMFRELQTDGEAEPDGFTLPDEVVVPEESSS
ncbi:hypothetical protein SUGI_0088420 [Cryptomeria japonica]|uniref:receptor-like protein kinase BRI1-like 3 n=1 Tax=Cryptomeria japonica TaxID=3369 RepID=UPI002408A1E8|nr:receptor-like protein kinase BRI1-like 3 [Cryptomeria japonica]GLJ08422.1 hypothetical protein SUGI_0088420 [Cryptomeria japonica]